MKKMMITESQLKRIKQNLMEQSDDNRYEIKVKVDLETYDLNYNGQEIDYASCDDITLTYIIELEGRSWGIKNIMVYDITGPEELEIEISLADGETSMVSVPVVWDNIETDELDSDGMISLNNEVEIKLVNDESGQIVVDRISIDIYR